MNKEEIFLKGMENDRYHNICVQKKILKKNILLFLFLLSGIIIGSYKEINVKEIYWINGNRGYQVYFKKLNNVKIFHGSFFFRVNRFRNYYSIFSVFKRTERIKILLRSIISFKKKSYGNIFYWIEYIYIYEFFERVNPITIITPHISDRQITWVSYIAKKKSIDLEIFQHGVTSNSEKIPNKIFCTKFNAISDEQIRINKLTTVLNKDCIFSIFPYKSVIEFSIIDKKDSFAVGIATQCNAPFIDRLLKEIMKRPIFNNKNVRFILMLHPLDKSKFYFLKKYENVVIEPQKKYINIDVLLTVNSTIIYDYFYSGFKGEIVQIDENSSVNFENDINVIKSFNRINDAVLYLEKIIKI